MPMLSWNAVKGVRMSWAVHVMYLWAGAGGEVGSGVGQRVV